jgi:hypothetical protein
MSLSSQFRNAQQVGQASAEASAQHRAPTSSPPEGDASPTYLDAPTLEGKCLAILQLCLSSFFSFFFTLDCLLLAKPSQLLAECWKDSFHSLLKNFEIDVPAAWPQTEFTSRFQLSYRDHITKNVSKEAGVALTRALWVALGM